MWFHVLTLVHNEIQKMINSKTSENESQDLGDFDDVTYFWENEDGSFDLLTEKEWFDRIAEKEGR